MATLEGISEAIKLIDTKKANLKRAFDDLQSQSHLLSSFSLSWSDIDSHFTSVQNELTQRFKALESLAAELRLVPCSTHSNHSGPSPSTAQLNEDRGGSAAARPSVNCVSTAPSTSTSVSRGEVESVVAPPELRGFCESMDWKGLSKYVNVHQKAKDSLKHELLAAFRCAPQPWTLVLDALEEVIADQPVSNGNKVEDPHGLKKSGPSLLEGLMALGACSSSEIRERAKIVALEWKKIFNMEQKPQTALCFVYLVAAYGLKSEFDAKELADCFILAARSRNATLLCEAVDFRDLIPDVIQKLLDTGKKTLAVKFIFDFGLTEKFPPVPILKAHVVEAQQTAKQVYDGNYSLQLQNEAKTKESNALKAVIRVIEEQKLQAEYPLESLKKRVEQLEKKMDKKRPAPASGSSFKHKQSKHQAMKHQHSGMKRIHKAGPVAPAAHPLMAGVGSSIQQFSQSHQQPPGYLPARSAAYLGSSSGHYGIAGSAPMVAPYTGSSAGYYGLPVTPQPYPENSNPAGYYDGYGLPSQYHQSYHPR